MTSRFRPDKNASQIVFDISGGEKHLQTMNLQTIPNRQPLAKSPKDSFILRNDDIEGSRYVPPKIHPRNPLETSDISGSASRPMFDASKPPVDLMRVDDIEGSHPRIIHQLPHSERNVNPVDPRYAWPETSGIKANPLFRTEESWKFVRRGSTMFNDDVEGAHPTPVDMSKPPRDIMRVEDISGARPTPETHAVRKGIDSLDVKDINNYRIFKSTRVTNPLNPVYHVHSETISDDFGHARPPPKPRQGFDPLYSTKDIDGAQAATSTRKFRAFRQPPPPREEEQWAPAEILMLPSMEKQTKELETKEAIRTMRGEKIRFYENRNLHADYGTGDPIQGALRRQRESRMRGTRHETF